MFFYPATASTVQYEATASAHLNGIRSRGDGNGNAQYPPICTEFDRSGTATSSNQSLTETDVPSPEPHSYLADLQPATEARRSQ